MQFMFIMVYVICFIFHRRLAPHMAGTKGLNIAVKKLHQLAERIQIKGKGKGRGGGVQKRFSPSP
jgi:hypothetical protein